jgi:predicted kinase
MIMKKCIVINGVSGSGKDTFVKVFQETTSLNVYNISSVDLIKEIMIKFLD